MFHVGMLLSGCGMYDGSEPLEVVPLLIALERARARTFCITVDGPQLHVVDHRTGDEMDGRRELAPESARLSRGRIETLDHFQPESVEALIVPGGYGVAKNLMSGFASQEEPRRIRPQVQALLQHFLDARKPLALVSLGKILLESLVADAFTESLRTELPDQVYEDPDRPVLYTPAYLVADRLGQVLPGLDALAERLLELCAEEDR